MRMRKTTFHRGSYNTYATAIGARSTQYSFPGDSRKLLRRAVVAAAQRAGSGYEVIRCICGVHVEEGEMIRCELCEVS